MKNALQNFVFSGLLAKHAVTDMEATGLVRSRATTNIERREQDLFSSVEESVRSGSLLMHKAYRTLFVLENIVRSLISDQLEKKFGTDWFDKKSSKEMQKKLTDRKEKEEKNLWHTGRNKDPIYYMDFGDLSKLITNNWSEFEDLLPSQSWVQSRLDEAERSRNVIAHTNVLSSEEVARLEMYLRDWIKQIG